MYARGDRVALAGTGSRLLTCLVFYQGRLVPCRDLFAFVWPGSRSIAKLRSSIYRIGYYGPMRPQGWPPFKRVYRDTCIVWSAL